MKITVIGTGYLGLVSGTCLAEVGYDPLCRDADVRKTWALHVPAHRRAAGLEYQAIGRR